MTFEALSLSQRIKRCREFCAPYRVTDGDKFGLKKFDPDDTGDLEAEDKPRAKEVLALGVETLAELQERLYAQNQWGILMITHGPRFWDRGLDWRTTGSVVIDGADDEEAETEDRCGAEGEDRLGGAAGAGDGG